MPEKDEFIRKLETSAFGAEITREIAEARLSERKAVVDRLAALNSAIEKEYPRHVAAVDKTAAEMRKCEEALRVARIKHAQAVGARTASSAIFSQTRNELERELALTASPLIAEFVSRMRDELRSTRKALTSRSWNETNFVTGANVQKIESNVSRIKARLAAIAAAIEASGEMALLWDQSKVPEALFRIEAELPPVEEI